MAKINKTNRTPALSGRDHRRDTAGAAGVPGAVKADAADAVDGGSVGAPATGARNGGGIDAVHGRVSDAKPPAATARRARDAGFGAEAGHDGDIINGKTPAVTARRARGGRIGTEAGHDGDTIDGKTPAATARRARGGDILTSGHDPAVLTARQAVQDARRNMLVAIKGELAQLNAAHPSTLALAVDGLLSARCEQKDLAELLGVSRTTISRWAQEQNIPRSPAFRKWAVEELITKLSEVLQATTEAPSPARPLPQHAKGYAGRSKQLTM